MPKEPLKDRIIRSVKVADNGCWNWIYRLNRAGYGLICIRSDSAKHNRFAHRMAYEAFVCPIPEGMTIDHLCDNKRCCNPEHLRIATALDNYMRYVRECRKDIDYRLVACGLPDHRKGRNLYTAPDGRKSCRACTRLFGKKYRGEPKPVRAHLCGNLDHLNSGNVYISPDGKRACRTCNVIYVTNYQLRKTGAQS